MYPSETCEYTLAKKNIGTNTIMRGTGRVLDDERPAAEDLDPDQRVFGAGLDPHEHGEHGEAADDAQPGAGVVPAPLGACSKPSTDKPIPTIVSAAPGQSIGSRLRVAGVHIAKTVSTSAMIATGTLIQKIARQVH